MANLSEENEVYKKRCELLQQEKAKLLKELSYVLDDPYYEIRKSSLWKKFVRIYNIKKKYFSNDSQLSLRINQFFKRFKFSKKHKIKETEFWRNIKIQQLDIKDFSKHISLPKSENPEVSIIIPVYNAWEMTYKCIFSIAQHTTNISFEIILCDDCSTDQTTRAAEIVSNIVYLRNETNLGFLRNCNHGAKYAKGKYLLFLNNDTEVTENWIHPLISTMEKDTNVGLVGSKLIYPNGKLQEAGGIIWSDASGWNYGMLKDPGAPEFNYTKEVDYISGASIMLRQDIWNQLGGFDDTFAPAYYEDTDLAFSIRNLGLKVVYQPKSTVIHFESYSHGKDRNSKKMMLQNRNRFAFLDKWKNQLVDEHFANGNDVFKARDRSAHKKTIVVIDQFVPRYDKDAGSRNTYLYLKLFVFMGFQVKYIGNDFRCEEPYTSELENCGIEVLYGRHYQLNWKQWFIEHSKYIDFVYFNRPDISLRYIDFIKENTSAKLIYFVHDLHFLRERRRFSIVGDAEIKTEANYWYTLEKKVFDKADVILTPNKDEEKIIREINENYQVKTIPLNYFETNASPVISFEERNDLLFVGGFNHTPNVDAVIWFCNEILPKICQVYPDIKINIVGSNAPDSILQLASKNICVLGYLTDDALKQIYNSSRVVVIPLRYGAGVKGKTLEAMFLGMPIVSTSIGIEGIPDVSSFLVANDDATAFANAVIKLYGNFEKLKELSLYETRYINQYFNKEAAVSCMATIFQ